MTKITEISPVEELIDNVKNSAKPTKEDLIKSKEISLIMFRSVLKDLKKTLPKACTFLSPITAADGTISIRFIANKEKYVIPIDQSFNMNDATINRIKSLILEKC